VDGQLVGARGGTGDGDTGAEGEAGGGEADDHTAGAGSWQGELRH
jgi:hypothetical protein